MSPSKDCLQQATASTAEREESLKEPMESIRDMFASVRESLDAAPEGSGKEVLESTRNLLTSIQESLDEVMECIDRQAEGEDEFYDLLDKGCDSMIARLGEMPDEAVCG
jgi:hypothetical protein